MALSYSLPLTPMTGSSKLENVDIIKTSVHFLFDLFVFVFGGVFSFYFVSFRFALLYFASLCFALLCFASFYFPFLSFPLLSFVLVWFGLVFQRNWSW